MLQSDSESEDNQDGMDVDDSQSVDTLPSVDATVASLDRPTVGCTSEGMFSHSATRSSL